MDPTPTKMSGPSRYTQPTSSFALKSVPHKVPQREKEAAKWVGEERGERVQTKAYLRSVSLRSCEGFITVVCAQSRSAPALRGADSSKVPSSDSVRDLAGLERLCRSRVPLAGSIGVIARITCTFPPLHACWAVLGLRRARLTCGLHRTCAGPCA